MDSPYAIRRIKLKNLRSIDEAEVFFESTTGLFRVGGRNGNGKSTAFHIGLSALMGLTSPLGLKTRGRESCFYEMENAYGVFGFSVNNRKVVYYYRLNDGRRDSSDMSVNNNICLDVIRAYSGFDIDLEFKSVLNLNSGKNLNFVYTNGRTDLKYFKQLVYSEEIESLQQYAIEEEKRIKKEIDRTSDKIGFLNAEVFKIKTIDEVWIRDAISWIDEVDKCTKSIEKFENTSLDIIKKEIQMQKIISSKTSTLMNILIYTYKCQKKVDIRKELSKNLYAKLNATPILDQLSNGVRLRNDLIKRNIITNLISVKSGVNSLNQLIDDCKDYKRVSTEDKLLRISNNRKNIEDLTIKLKSTKKINMYGKIQERNLEKAILMDFVLNLSKQRKVFVQNSLTRFCHLFNNITDYQKALEVNTKLNQELDDNIYKDGRCILCYSVKSQETK